MNDNEMKEGICPNTGKLCYPAIRQAARICKEFRAEYKARLERHNENLGTVIMFNSFISAMIVFVVLLLTVPIGGEVFIIAAFVALFPWLLYKVEERYN